MGGSLISIVMSIYNEPIHWIEESILSILNQTYSNIEFIIVLDNPNRFDVIELINLISDERIVFLKNSKNSGLIYSLNKAVSIASGEYIARMDADDISHLNRLERQLNYLVNSDLDLIGCYVNLVDCDLNHLTLLKKVKTHKYIVKLLELGIISIVHPTFFGKSHIFKKCLYNVSALYAEDMEFLCHIISEKFKVGNLDEVLFDCRYNDMSVTKRKTDIMENTVLNIVKSFKKYKMKDKYEFGIYSHATNFQKMDIKNKLLDVRKFYSNKKYFNCFLKLIEAFISEPLFFLFTLRNSFYKIFFSLMEKIK